jgi:polysaccharide biosynthesis transport protein
LSLFRRRKGYFYFPLILASAICIGGAYVLPLKYEASTTILVQREEVMVPLVRLTGDFAMSTDDRFGTFNEITFSRAAVETLIDSLQLGKDLKTANDREVLIRSVRKNIKTSKPGETTYRITFFDSDPTRAKMGDDILSRYFIRTILQVENRRNEVALEFFQEKVGELRANYEEKQTNVVGIMRSRIQEMPVQHRTLLDNLDAADKQNTAIDQHLKDDQKALNLLQQFSQSKSIDGDKQILFDLGRINVPHMAELQPFISSYVELTKKYTVKHPEVQKTRKRITELLSTVRDGIVQDTLQQQRDRADLEQRRAQLMDGLKQKSTVAAIDVDAQSDLTIARKLYDEMSVKVEQARQTKDLGSKGSEQFIIIDAPVIPAEPTQPDRLNLILNGIVLGLLIGFLSAICKELLDPTIRTIHDIGAFHKGVIALIPEKRVE